MSTRFFVTGAQGFIGRYLVAHLLTSRPDAVVVGIGRSPELATHFPHALEWAGSRRPAPLPPDLGRALADDRYRYAPVEITARARLAQALRGVRPHVVVHLASGLRDDPPPHLFRTNVDGTATLVEAIVEAAPDLRRLVVGSSGGVYGTCGDARLPFDETAPCRPADPYARSKLAAEHVAGVLARRHGIDVVCARLFNVVGAGEDDRHVGPELARQAAEILHGLRPAVLEAADLQPTRDFIDVRDVARALTTLVDRGTAGTTYNVATGRESSIASVLGMVLDAAGLQGAVEIRHRAGPHVAVRRHCGDVRRLRDLGFHPRIALAESLGDLVRYYTEVVASNGRSPVAAGP